MKATGTIEEGTGLWHAPNLGASNSSGFTALPGGQRWPDGAFSGVGSLATYWGGTPSAGTTGFIAPFDRATVPVSVPSWMLDTG